MSGDGEGRGRVTRALTVAGVTISVVAGGLGLLFTLQPDLKPCLGDSDAEFIAAPVFPQTSRKAYLRRTGASNAELADEVEQRGAEIRFSYHTDGLRNRDLSITSTLLTIERDGTLGRVVNGHDRTLQVQFKPGSCSETGGNDVFVEIPEGARRRYQIVLELFRDDKLADRVALTRTAVFRG
jgi:hypothetical protein